MDIYKKYKKTKRSKKRNDKTERRTENNSIHMVKNNSRQRKVKVVVNGDGSNPSHEQLTQNRSTCIWQVMLIRAMPCNNTVFKKMKDR